jgi:hypothetical protein
MKKQDPRGDNGSDHYLGEENLDADAVGGRDDDWNAGLKDGKRVENKRLPESDEVLRLGLE